MQSAETPYHFNPRSPHGERRGVEDAERFAADISIHAPRTGSDTPLLKIPNNCSIMSIHAPRTGSDQMEEKTKTAGTDFNPRSPHGERRPAEWRTPMIYKFQSTLPARGATEMKLPNSSADLFQSTLPARGATPGDCDSVSCYFDFNPRSPHGERLLVHQDNHAFFRISIHAPRTGSDEAQ